jgi:hypothetical protein
MTPPASTEGAVSREPLALDFSPYQHCRIVGIDGDMGAGKSTLAREINAAIGGTIISVDDFLEGNGQPYLSQLDFGRLSKALSGATPPIVIEGVLLQDVLHRLGLSADCTVFARREYEGITMHGSSAEISEYYRRCSPWRTAQQLVTLHIDFSR